MSGPWNACPACGKLVSVSEYDADGTELPCDGCDVGLVIAGFGDERKLEFMPSDNDDDDGAAPWNTCPGCNVTVDIDGDAFDGANVQCRGCREDLVIVEYEGDTWGIILAQEDNDEDHEPHAGVCGGGE